MPRFLSPTTAATMESPSRDTPLMLPRSIFHASIACLPVVSASLPIRQPPVNTSAVRASTYVPLIEVPLAAIKGDAITRTIVANTKARFMSTSNQLRYRLTYDTTIILWARCQKLGIIRCQTPFANRKSLLSLASRFGERCQTPNYSQLLTPPSQLAAAPFTLTDIRPDRLTVGPKSS